ncbi:delta(1)-pyrroline-2-carboxylate reductase family protein [Rhizobacter sp. OV335]|uniref:delta(1)-pyrroline-2-carboxylate reductase family protein n=1 Tax=Rhizobacter sp. OV335 TaxID=1500264 RepID=UPI0009137BBC|nr:delta(1)-pyrroline-2-carboxylate reductase family protein [Rhizobacter sp. OV335]SHN24320.1 ornithine cyclodeaminase [Rhizobacter sp. OV335]
MRQIDAAQTAALLPWRPLADAVMRAAIERDEGRLQAPVRSSFALSGDDRLLLMPASDQHYASVKLVTVNHGNPALGRERVQGEVLLMDRATGERLAMFDGVTVTARRTAAVSLAAALALKVPAGERLLIVGAGAQALAHGLAFDAVLAPAWIGVAARSRVSADGLVAALAAQGVTAHPVDDIGAEIGRCGLIVTATTSRSAVIPDALRPGARVFAVGAFTPAMCELPAALVRRAALVVDDLDGAKEEAGDLIQAGVDWSKVRGLAQAAELAGAGDAPVVFKSVGSAAWDLAAARFAWDRLSAC